MTKLLQFNQKTLDHLKTLKKDPNQGGSQAEMEDRIEEMQTREHVKFMAEMKAAKKKD
jgi:hypothetical protein